MQGLKNARFHLRFFTLTRALLPTMKRLAIASAVLILFDGSQAALAAGGNFDIANGQTITSGQSLGAGQTGVVESGGTLNVSSGVGIKATGSATITNSGTILDTDDRAIRDNTGGLTLSVTNNAGASITSTIDDAFQMNKGNSNVTLDNYGTITSGTPTQKAGQAIDWNAIETGSNVLNNHAGGLIQAYDADAVRPGVNGVVHNDGVIQSIYSTEANDGVDMQNNSGGTIVNATTGTDTVAGTGQIIGSRHGITGGAADDTVNFTLGVTNNKGGVIQGNDGSGINIDGFNAKEMVTVVNHGTITGNGVTGDGDGVDVDGLVNIANTGSIIGKQSLNDTSEGVTVGGGTIVNSGLIEGDNTGGSPGVGITLAGVDKDADKNPIPPEAIYADTAVTNSGTIRGQSGAGIQMTSAIATPFKVTITNLAGGLIEGGGGTDAAIQTQATRVAIANYGTIQADQSGTAIDFGSSSGSSLQVLGGSARIIGDIKGSSAGDTTASIAPGSGNIFSYDGAMSNLASVDIGTGTTVLNGKNTYAGATTVAGGGALVVNGAVAGPVAVGSDAILAGVGSVGATTLANGAILAPGSLVNNGGALSTTLGTLTVNGDLSFAPGSIYRVQADPASSASDKVHVTGTANLAGSVLHVGPDGNFAAFRTYDILSADGGLSGSFGSVQSNYAFLAPSLSYGKNDVGLTLTRNAASFASLAQTGNQRAAAQALDNLPRTGALYGQIVTLTGAQAAAAFQSLSGEAHASAATALQSVGGTASSLPLAHLQANLGAGQLPGSPTAQAGGSDAATDASTLPSSAAYPVWAQVFGSWGTVGGGNGTSKVSTNDGGLYIGTDRGVGNGWRLGGALGYTGSNLSTQGISSTAATDSYTAALYGGKAFAAGAGAIKLSGGGAFTWHDISTKRSIHIGSSLDQTLSASYHANTSQLFAELGYAMPLNAQGAAVEPFIGANWSDLRTRGFSESGGTAALNGASSSTDLATTTLGLHASTAFALDQMRGTLRGSLGWRHTFGNVQPQTTLAFQDSQPFTVSGAPIARDAAAVELGVEVAITRNTMVSLSYNGQFGSGNQQNAGILNVKTRF